VLLRAIFAVVSVDARLQRKRVVCRRSQRGGGENQDGTAPV